MTGELFAHLQRRRSLIESSSCSYENMPIPSNADCKAACAVSPATLLSAQEEPAVHPSAARNVLQHVDTPTSAALSFANIRRHEIRPQLHHARRSGTPVPPLRLVTTLPVDLVIHGSNGLLFSGQAPRTETLHTVKLMLESRIGVPCAQQHLVLVGSVAEPFHDTTRLEFLASKTGMVELSLHWQVSCCSADDVAMAIATKTYEAQSLDELNLRLGDTISLTGQEAAEGWMHGKHAHSEVAGVFPADHVLVDQRVHLHICSLAGTLCHLRVSPWWRWSNVKAHMADRISHASARIKLLVDNAEATDADMVRQSSEGVMLVRLPEPEPDFSRCLRAVVVRHFHAVDNQNMLDLQVGDVVYVLEQDESGWWGGHKEDDEVTGWFPGECVDVRAE